MKLTTFIQVLAELRGGATLAELNDQLHEIVTAVNDTRKKGSIKIAISVAPTKSGAAIEFDCKTAIAPPEPDRDTTLFFALDDGSVSRQHPSQTSIFDDEPNVESIASNGDTNHD